MISKPRKPRYTRIQRHILNYDSDTYYKPGISNRKLKLMESRLISEMLACLDGVTLARVYEEVR